VIPREDHEGVVGRTRGYDDSLSHEAHTDALAYGSREGTLQRESYKGGAARGGRRAESAARASRTDMAERGRYEDVVRELTHHLAGNARNTSLIARAYAGWRVCSMAIQSFALS
jgi:hypothetical protein